MGANNCKAAARDSSTRPFRMGCNAPARKKPAGCSSSWSFLWVSTTRTHKQDIVDHSTCGSCQTLAELGGSSPGVLKIAESRKGGADSRSLTPFPSPPYPTASRIDPSSSSTSCSSSNPSHQAPDKPLTVDGGSLQESRSLALPACSNGSPGEGYQRESSSDGLQPTGSVSEVVVSDGEIPSLVDTCSVCLKLLKDRSPWCSQEVLVGDELDSAAVLACGHVYHTECLEIVASDTGGSEPSCPACQWRKSCLKKANMTAMLAGVVVTDADISDPILGRRKRGEVPRIGLCSSMKCRPSLRRPFSSATRPPTRLRFLFEGQVFRKGFWTRFRTG